jgi:HAD superfamily hydrolase (TIGR01509 family)
MDNAKLRVKGVLLDLDGTLVDSKEAYSEAVKAAFAATGRKMRDSRIVTEIPKKLEQNLPINEVVKGVDMQKFLQTYLRVYYQVTSVKTKPIPNTSNTLKKLSEKTRLALVTMRYVPKKEIIKELEKMGLAKYFQCVITALDTCDPKPSPDAIIECAKRLGIKTSECVVVGDSVADIKAGKTAGAKTVAVLSGIFSREELEKEKPDIILENVNKLPDFIE